MPETSDHASAADTGPTRLDQSQYSHLENLYRAAIGPLHADYYLPILSRFEAYGRATPSWNWAACAVTLNWMLFRGLWVPAVLYLAGLSAAALALAAGLALADPPPADSVRWSLWAALLTLALLAPGFFGNAWLYRVYRRRLDTALGATTSLKDATMLLARQSSSRPRLLAIALANAVLAVLLAASSWPTDLQRRMWPWVSGDVGAMTAPDTGSIPHPAIPASASEPPPVPITGQAIPEVATETAAPVVQATSRATTAPVLADHDGLSAGPYLVNVGLFAQQDNALRAHARLDQAGLPAISESLQTPAGQRTRVRVGPFATRAQADAAAQQIRALQLEAIVIRP